MVSIGGGMGGGIAMGGMGYLVLWQWKICFRFLLSARTRPAIYQRTTGVYGP